MSLASDYFLLYHGIPLLSAQLQTIDQSIPDETFFEIASLLLSLNRSSFESMLSLKSFSPLVEHLSLQPLEHLEGLYFLQHSIINDIIEHRSGRGILSLHQSWSYLYREKLLDIHSYEKLTSLFDPLPLGREEQRTPVPEVGGDNFQSEKEAVIAAIDQLKNLSGRREGLDGIIRYLSEQKFSIGITGVVNAGKSTMLNALMGKELLGTGVVPETANLTLLKYSQTPYAKVVYWNRSQWHRIEESAKSIAAMRTFVDETRKHYRDEIDGYILEQSREDTVDIGQLSDFTSASASDKKCNLVQYVELGTPLEFLQEGIEIVDTPGLDDVVIQREEITKEYLGKCDLLIHLMNVSQSATQKDIEFIVDALLHQHISKLLVIITRVDTVREEEVAEVIAYTKKSIAARLHTLNSDSKLDFILRGIRFIALSGKMALLHKTGHAKAALDRGYILEKSGITEVEDYLRETLFSKQSQRASLIIHSAKKRLSIVVEESLERFRFERALLFKSEDETGEELGLLQLKKGRQQEAFARLQEQIAGYDAEMRSYLATLQFFIGKELAKLQGLIKQRLLDELTYSLEKDKKTPEKNRLHVIVESALKHGIVDILRDYRYKFVKKSSKIFEEIALGYDDIGGTDPNREDFDPQLLFGDAFKKGFWSHSSDVLQARIDRVMAHAAPGKLAKTDQLLKDILHEEFLYLEEQLNSRVRGISTTLLDEFIVNVQAPIDALERGMHEHESMLQNHLLFLDTDQKLRDARAAELSEHIRNIEHIAQRCGL